MHNRPAGYPDSMDMHGHWENVYASKKPTEVSWFRPHLDSSLSLVARVAPDRGAHIIDVGGGESTLVDDLLSAGYRNLTVLDISQKALDVTRERLGDAAASVTWRAADCTSVDLPTSSYDIWHDRAVFHFLTSPEDRIAYVKRVAQSVRPGGFVIIGTFGPEGPKKCSGLDVVRYDSSALHREFGTAFRLLDSLTEIHQTPFGTTQQFLYCLCAVEPNK